MFQRGGARVCWTDSQGCRRLADCRPSGSTVAPTGRRPPRHRCARHCGCTLDSPSNTAHLVSLVASQALWGAHPITNPDCRNLQPAPPPEEPQRARHRRPGEGYARPQQSPPCPSALTFDTSTPPRAPESSALGPRCERAEPASHNRACLEDARSLASCLGRNPALHVLHSPNLRLR